MPPLFLKGKRAGSQLQFKSGESLLVATNSTNLPEPPYVRKSEGKVETEDKSEDISYPINRGKGVAPSNTLPRKTQN